MYTAIRKSLNKENDKGFTLIELLVVIIIIGILAAIAIPIFLNQRKKAVDASSKSDARTIATQLETFYTDGSVYPGTVTAATNATTGTTTLTIGTETVVLSPGNSAKVYLNGAAASATAFCVKVANPKATRDYVWQSNAGGLLPAAAAVVDNVCPAAFTATPGVTIL